MAAGQEVVAPPAQCPGERSCGKACGERSFSQTRGPDAVTAPWVLSESFRKKEPKEGEVAGNRAENTNINQGVWGRICNGLRDI